MEQKYYSKKMDEYFNNHFDKEAASKKILALQ